MKKDWPSWDAEIILWNGRQREKERQCERNRVRKNERE